MKTERCESCFRVFATEQMTTVSNDRVCRLTCEAIRREQLKTAKQKRPSAKSPLIAKPEPSVSGALSRCERCNTLHRTALMTYVNELHLCQKCARPTKQWYAVAISGSDAKVRKSIKTKLDADGLANQLGRILIPKARSMKVTQDRYNVLDNQNKVIGQVSAVDPDEALFKAKAQFGQSKKRTLYKPEPTGLLTLDKIVRTKEGRRVVYLAIAKVENGEKILGKVFDPKESRARETIERLYGAKDEKRTNPRETNIDPTDVKEVQLAKQGGRKMFQNAKSMPGYLLVECFDDDRVFTSIRKARGVYSMMPYPDPITFEQYERAEDNTDLPPRPAPLAESEVERMTATPESKPAVLNYEIGDQVRVTSGSFANSNAIVRDIKGSAIEPIIVVEVTIMQRPIKIEVPHTQIRK